MRMEVMDQAERMVRIDQVKMLGWVKSPLELELQQALRGPLKGIANDKENPGKAWYSLKAWR